MTYIVNRQFSSILHLDLDLTSVSGSCSYRFLTGVKFSLTPPLWYAPGELIIMHLSLWYALGGLIITIGCYDKPPLVVANPPPFVMDYQYYDIE